MKNRLIELSVYQVQLFPVQLQCWHSMMPFLSLFLFCLSSFFQTNPTFLTSSALFCLGFSPRASDFALYGLFYHTLHIFGLSSSLLRTYLRRILVQELSPFDDFLLVGPERLLLKRNIGRCYSDLKPNVPT